MKHFIDDNSAYAFEFPEEFKDDLKPLCTTEVRLTGSVTPLPTIAIVWCTHSLPNASTAHSLRWKGIIWRLYAKLNPFDNPEGIPNPVIHKYSCSFIDGRMISCSSSSECFLRRRSPLLPSWAWLEWFWGQWSRQRRHWSVNGCTRQCRRWTDGYSPSPQYVWRWSGLCHE